MVANAIDWPRFLPRKAMFYPESASRSGGQSLSGSEQVNAINPRWRARVAGPVVTETSVLAWRSFVASMNGRAGTVLVPKWERRGVRDANGRELSQVNSATYDTDELNFDLSGFGQSDLTHATLAANASLNDTRISVTILDGEGPRPGQYIGIGDRLHLVSLAWEVSEGAPLQLQFTPWLRASALAGARVILDRPVCLMRFAQDMTGELELDMGLWGDGTLEFVEAI